MQALEIEYLTGVVAAARDEDAGELDWPPQPDRVFSALVASWAARGKRGDERAALEWLECQVPPVILAGTVAARSTPVVYVPPNDFKTSKAAPSDLKTSKANLSVIPSRRKRQARRFPAGYLADRVVHHVWPRAEAPQGVCEALDALARDTSYVGHSRSLTRCRFLDIDVDLSLGRSPTRRVYEGRFAELESAFQRGRRPAPGDAFVASREPAVQATAESLLGERWIVLEDAGGLAPDLRSAALIACTLRLTLMKGFTASSLRGAEKAPEWLSGHGPGGAPSARPHLAYVPLADIGWTHSQGQLKGFAIVLPRELSGDDEQRLHKSLKTQLVCLEDDDRRLEIHYGGDAPWCLTPTEKPTRASLKPARWFAPLGTVSGANGSARLWASATPIVLDRFPKKQGAARDEEIAQTVRRACVNVGLPEPAHVTVSAESAIPGVPPAYSGSKLRQWERWQLPHALEHRMLLHAILGFSVDVRGPVVIGAGRYVGLGLCLPFDQAGKS